MTTTHRPIRRRLTLLASPSAAIVLMTAAGGAATLAPNTAMGMNECGVQSGATPVICLPRIYPSGISYSATPGSDFNLVLQHGVTSWGALSVLDPSGENINVTASTANAGDITIANESGYGVLLESGGAGGVTLDLTDAGRGHTRGYIAGGDRGVSARSGGPILLNLDRVPVFAVAAGSVGIMGSAGGDLTIRTAAPVSARLIGIEGLNYRGGDINVTTTASATILATFGIMLSGNAGITLVADGDLGTPLSRVSSGVLVSNLGIPAAFGENTRITVNGDIYTSAGGISASNSALAGNLDIVFGQSRAATLDGGYRGISASGENPRNTGDVAVSVGDGSAILSVIGVTANNSGLGMTSVNLGSRVRISGISGVLASSSKSRASITAGDRLNVDLARTGIWDSTYGLSASSSAAADKGGPSAKITIGQNATLTNTDPLTYDVGFVQATTPNGTASASITIGDGVVLSQAGDFVAGVLARTNLGDVSIDVGTGSIDLTGGSPRSFGVQVPASGGILALSLGGDVTVTSAVDMNVVGNTSSAGGIRASTAGLGNVTVSSSGSITSNGMGIDAFVSDGAMSLSSSGVVDTALLGIRGVALGSGSVALASSGSVSGDAIGLLANSQTGAINIDNSGSASGDVAIYATSVDGRIVIGNSGSVTGTTTGILAATTGSSRISVTSSGSVQGGDAAIDVSTLTGDLAVNATGALSGDTGLRAVSQGGTVHVASTGGLTATTTGIDATANGAGSLTVHASAVQSGGIGVLATTATSDARVIASGDVAGGTGPAIQVNSGGAATVDVGNPATVWTTYPTPALDITAAGSATINNDGVIRSNLGRPQDLVVVADATSVALNNNGLLQGAVDFSASDSLAFTNAGTWRTGGMSLFTGGDDTLTNTGAIIDDSVTIDFGAGSDTFANAGTLVVGEGPASTLALANLETFNNSGLILFGAQGSTTDGEANDRLVAHGAAFTGSDGSTLAMDVDLGAASQANCSAATVADCFDLTGGSTAGSTLIRVTDTGQSAGALNTDGIVLADVHGGTSHAGDFTLDSASSGYLVDPTLGAGLEKGLFLYRLNYDAANQRHELVSLPSSRAFEFAPLAASAQSVWYTSVGSWFDRQADLRDTLAAGDTGPGVWIKMAGSNDNRNATTAYGPYQFNISNKQDTFAALAGIDLLQGASDGQGYVVGLTAGNLNSDIQFKASRRSAKLEGQSYGAYASWLSNSIFLDAIVQQNDLDLRDNGLMGAKGKVKSTGGQVEGGWRMPFAMVSVEPLASLAYVRTKFDDIALPGATLETRDAKSLRGSLGVRVSGDTDLHSATLRWQATGRVWDEFEGKNRAVLLSNGESVGMPDDVSGAFGDVGVGISLYSPSGHVSTFLNTGMKFKSDYRSTDTAIGFRVQW